MGRKSTAVAAGGTVLDVAVAILAGHGESLGPSAIAKRGIEVGLLRVPRGRTKGYLTQIVQSTLHDNAEYTQVPSVYRPGKGKYRIRRAVAKKLDW